MAFSGRCRRNADDGGVGRNGTDDHAAGPNLGADANLYIPEDFGSGSDERPTPHFRMAITAFLSGFAQGHVLKDRYVVFDNRRLADKRSLP